MYEWVVIGGGLHGVHIAARLVDEFALGPSEVAILDPATHLLAPWRERTRSTGMQFLRSPSVHNLDVDPMSLLHFAARSRGSGRRFATPSTASRNP